MLCITCNVTRQKAGENYCKFFHGVVALDGQIYAMQDLAQKSNGKNIFIV